MSENNLNNVVTPKTPDQGESNKYQIYMINKCIDYLFLPDSLFFKIFVKFSVGIMRHYHIFGHVLTTLSA